MLDYLFVPGTTHEKLLRRNLRIEAKLMLIVCTHNVIPRRGDKMEVRFLEVPILYMMMHGAPLVPFRFLVLNNICLGRNSGERKIVPRCRLITALLKKYGAIGAEDKGSYKRYHKLKTDRKKWGALKVDARPLRPVKPMSPRRVMRRLVEMMTTHYDPYWAHTGNVGHVIEQRQPPTFGDWSEPNQMLFDQQTYMGARMERALKQSYDRQEQWNQAHMCAYQEEMNNRYLDDH
ncbi:hypothetical protein Hanom_Chr11g01035941 [Helianthus anomalus]